MANLSSPDGIVLLAKQPGLTSFASLHSVKKALGTTKVGHTGTLDSFAQGLLVVCTGHLTKLAGCITEFNKSYSAVIKFGEETDTLEYTGEVIQTAQLPTLNALNEAIKKYTGNILQAPPAFSAIHVNGKRASDLAREGRTVEIPPRPITVFSANLIETKLTDDGYVEYCRIDFSVSKGTYIRSLARDIAYECGSAAHLTGLYRTKVGSFKIEDAAGYSKLKPFSIEEALKSADSAHSATSEKKSERRPFVLLSFNHTTAADCGFESINIASASAQADFFNGKKLTTAMFAQNLRDYPAGSQLAVFNEEKRFLGLINKDEQGRPGYRFVLN